MAQTTLCKASECLLWALIVGCDASNDAELRSVDMLNFTEPRNLGASVNTAAFEGGPSISFDGLSLFFASARNGGEGREDVWVATRPTASDTFATPVNLGAIVNGPDNDACPRLSPNALSLYFCSMRPGGSGSFDIWMSERQVIGEPFGPAQWLEGEVNSDAWEGLPRVTPDGLTLYFDSDRGGGLGGFDIWLSTRSSVDEEFGPPLNLGSPLNSAHFEGGPALSPDGASLLFMSDRPGGQGSADLWVIRLESGRPVGEARNLGQTVNSPGWEFGPDLRADGRELYFASDRAGGFGDFDLYVSVRQR